MIPLKVSFDNGETFLDRFEISPAIFVQKMAANRTLPKTSTPDPQTFIEYFQTGLEKKGQVLFISLSSGLSGTFQTAQLANNMLGNNKVRIFDTLTGSLGTGIMAIKAAQMAAAGLALDLVVEKLNAIRAQSETLFTLDTLDNVVKGGRLSRIEGFAGTLLNIKPILRNDNIITGVPAVIEKVRSRRKAMERLVSLMGERAGATINQRLIGVSHVNCKEEAQQLCQQIIQRYNPLNPIIIAPMSATIGTYAGEGGMMVNL